MGSRILALLVLGGMALLPAKAEMPGSSLVRAMAADDPNRDPQWPFWLDQTPEVYYVNRNGDIKRAGVNVDFRLPYFSYGSTTYSPSGSPDVRPEDGWVLVLRDFGTAQAAPTFPHFALYNKYRGILRLFVYNSWGLSSQSYSCSVGFYGGPSDTNLQAGIMTFPSATRCFLNNYDPTQTLSTFANMNADSWSSYDFVMAGYDPNLKNKPDVAFNIKFKGLNRQDLKATGTIQGDISQIIDKAPPSFAKSDTETLKEAVAKGASFYHGYKDASDSLTKQANDPSNANAWWQGAALTLASSFLTGGSAPLVAGAVGFVSSFIGGGSKQAPMIPMNFKANLALEIAGSLTSETDVTSPGFHLNYSTNPAPSQRVPVAPIPWGVFNIAEKPALLVQESYRVDARISYEPDANPNYYWIVKERYAAFSGYQVTLTTNPTVHINPDTGMTLASQKIAFTSTYQAPSAFMATGAGPFLVSFIPDGLSYELKFNVQNTSGMVYGDPVQVFYKVVPTDISQGEPVGFFEPTILSRKRVRGVPPNND